MFVYNPNTLNRLFFDPKNFKRKYKSSKLGSIECKCGRVISFNKRFFKACTINYTDEILQFMKDNPIPYEPRIE